MEQNHVIYAFDLGSENFNAVAAEYNDKEKFSIRIIDSQSTKSVGMRRGRIDSPELVARNINTMVQSFEKKLSNKNIKHYYCFSLNGLAYFNESRNKGMTISQSEPSEINENHIKKLIDNAKSESLIDDSQIILNIRPINHTLDYSNVTYDLKNRTCKYLESTLNLTIAQRSDVDAINRVCDIIRSSAKFDYEISFCPIPSAKSLILLTQEDIRNGSMLIDFGAQTTSIAIYKKGILTYEMSIPFGTNTITSDLSKVLEISYANAETIKRSFDFADEDNSGCICKFEFDDKEELKCPFDKIKFIIGARLDEILTYIDSGIEKSRCRKEIKRVILTGQGAELQGLCKKASVFLALPCTKLDNNDDIRKAGAVGIAALFVRENKDKFIVRNPTLFDTEPNSAPQEPEPQKNDTDNNEKKAGGLKKIWNSFSSVFDDHEKNINE